MKAYQSVYSAANKESKAAYAAANKERQAAAQAAWYQANKERRAANIAAWRAANKDRVAAKVAAWKRDNPDRVKASSQRRRASKASAAGDHTAEQLKARFDYHGNRCVYCNSANNLHADHQIPLSRGGTNFASNMVPACASCNTSKNDKTPIEFADYTFRKLQAMLGSK